MEEWHHDIPCTSAVFPCQQYENPLGVAKMQIAQSHPRPMKAGALGLGPGNLHYLIRFVR